MSDQNHASTFEAPSIEEVSRLFPAYEVHQLIACGGMGAVYYATQLSLDRVVAIKILPREFSNDVNFRDSFEAEAKAMARLNHPNLIGIYDFGKVEGMFFIVMEYVDGLSLYHHTHGQAVERQDAIAITLGVCQGLAHAHEYGILHRDIKPSNILMDSNMNPKIGDFGLAQAMGKAIEDGEQIFGTPGYTAPEVIEPPHVFDQRADVFSVGVMLQELLTGRTPNPQKLLDDELAVSNPRISAVIRAAIDPDPRYRTKTIAEFAEALRKVANPKRRAQAASGPIAGRSALGRPSGAMRAPQQLKKPQRTVSSAGGDSSGTIWMLVLLVVVAAVVLVVVSKKRGDARPQSPSENQASGISSTAYPDPKNGTEAPAGQGGTLDVESILRTARSAASQRISPDYESCKRELRQIAETLKNDLKQMVPASVDVIDLNFSNWQSNGYRISGALPNELTRHSGVSATHRRAMEEQRGSEARLEERIKLQSGIYILELQDLIEKMRESASQAEISRLEDEVRRTRESAGYFRSLMPK